MASCKYSSGDMYVHSTIQNPNDMPWKFWNWLDIVVRNWQPNFATAQRPASAFKRRRRRELVSVWNDPWCVYGDHLLQQHSSNLRGWIVGNFFHYRKRVVTLILSEGYSTTSNQPSPSLPQAVCKAASYQVTSWATHSFHNLIRIRFCAAPPRP